MRVIDPYEINPYSISLVSNIAEPYSGDPTLWTASTNYSTATTVYTTALHRTYICKIAGVDSTPPDQAIYKTPPKWVETGSTNKYRMFDHFRNNRTISTSSTIAVTATPAARIDAIAVLDLINVTSISINITYSYGTTWSYINNSFTGKNYINFNIPVYSNPIIVVTLIGTGTIECGALIFGVSRYLGITKLGIVNGLSDLNPLTRDNYGTAVIAEKSNISTISVETTVEAKLLNKIIAIRKQLNAKPAIWCSMETSPTFDYYNMGLLRGYYKTFDISIDNHIVASINLQLEEI